MRPAVLRHGPVAPPPTSTSAPTACGQGGRRPSRPSGPMPTTVSQVMPGAAARSPRPRPGLPPRRPRRVATARPGWTRPAPPALGGTDEADREGQDGCRMLRPDLRRSSRWNRAVGALPMATTAPSRHGRQSSTAAADAWSRAEPPGRPCARRRGWPHTSLPAGRRSSITPARTGRIDQHDSATGRVHRTACAGSPCQAKSGATSGMPQAWTSRSTMACSGRGKRVQRDPADQVEGAGVDRRWIGDSLASSPSQGFPPVAVLHRGLPAVTWSSEW